MIRRASACAVDLGRTRRRTHGRCQSTSLTKIWIGRATRRFEPVEEKLLVHWRKFVDSGRVASADALRRDCDRVMRMQALLVRGADPEVGDVLVLRQGGLDAACGV